jgi:DNA (cytosine-5)-methyltransferase 1
MLRALDLFCCAGGATKGLQMVGYHVTGVDIRPQPRYCGDVFYRDDAMAWLRGERESLEGFDLIWASPPCQRYSRITPLRTRKNHADLLPDVLEQLREQDTPYIVENVEGTQHLMQNPVLLCGTMFGLNIWRHRWFEIGGVPGLFFLLPPCNHSERPILISGRGMRGVRKGGGRPSEPLKATKVQGIQIDWMITKELDEAIPPAYSRFLATQILEASTARKAA